LKGRVEVNSAGKAHLVGRRGLVAGIFDG
jgi:hypothetical protein